jgi:hypothetical protein
MYLYINYIKLGNAAICILQTHIFLVICLLLGQTDRQVLNIMLIHIFYVLIKGITSAM